eukprot:TRINITY_DN986_c0_g1_i1.p1 TRINITY_DN986_c0_g1~~TRINITY_DN986_c0_g1_i1.p1  ORF type:complete len:476 (-),score=162.17 TRINITY_DN986_c0_g1_i1:250-1572(-)
MPRKKQREENEDHSATLEKELPAARKLALEDKKLSEALDKLFALEKLTRQGGDFVSCKKVAQFIVKLCHDCEDDSQLKNSLSVIAKRRGQEHAVIQVAVQEAMGLLEGMPKDKKLELLDTLRTITEGKIFVELERAELTRTLAQIKEADGEVKEAAKILQEVQVETLGKMEKKDKVEYILEQVRLCLDSEDFIRAIVLARKINPKVLLADGFQEVKLRYYETMIRYHKHKRNFLDICAAYRHIYDTDVVKEDTEKREHNLKLACLFCVLSKSDPEQSNVLRLLYEDKNLITLAPYKVLLKFFLTEELIRWPSMRKQYDGVLGALDAVQGDAALWDDLKSRVIEHNIRICSLYYTKIRYSRFAQLLDLEPAEAETYLAKMVVDGAVYAIMDRPAAIVTFARPCAPADVLNEWSGNISELLGLLENTCHLIHREAMIHGQGR